MCAQDGVADFTNLGVRAATQLDPYFVQFAPQAANLADVQPATLGVVIQPCVVGASRRPRSCSWSNVGVTMYSIQLFSSNMLDFTQQ